MRLSVLVNLAVILAVSGLLLFVVFSASLERSELDQKIRQGPVVLELIETQLLKASSTEDVWELVRTVCVSSKGLKVLVYDKRGEVLGGCEPPGDSPKPDVRNANRHINVTVAGVKWPRSLFKDKMVVADLVDAFPHGVRAIRCFLDVPPLATSPALKFFTLYLVLTQASLFFLGYILFHRSILGPIRDVAAMAGKAAGMTDSPFLAEALGWRSDIQVIAASLKGMMLKVLDDREKLHSMIEELQKTNKNLEAAQEGLIRSERLAGVGRLAAGLTHEIGNPLQIMLGYAELLEAEPDPQKRTEIITKLEQELHRIQDILQELLNFASPRRDYPQRCHINALIHECASLVQGRKGFKKIRFEHDLQQDLPTMETEPEKIRQVLVNLLFNAADALGDKEGTVVFRTRRDGDRIQVTLEDNGSGIEPEHIEKVFDPFFTTKQPGKGTGLGLAVCVGLIESLGGTIEIASEPGKGTSVTFRLPLRRAVESGNWVEVR
ncbi:MAG: ATP-binding protein [Thermodesulfobacteriota bacterium]